MVRCDGQCLLVYKSELLSVLKLTLHVVCKEVLSLSCTLLKHVLKALTLIYANDYRTTTVDWDLPLSEVLPIRVSAALHNVLLTHLLVYFYLHQVNGVNAGDTQGGHKPGKPGILRDFFELGKLGILRELHATSGKVVTNKVFLVRHSNICVKQLLTG